MSFEGWIVFATFWALFVTTPGPNAANILDVAMSRGFTTALWCVAAILCQASLFLTLSALGLTALITGAPALFGALQIAGALVLIILGIRAWRRAAVPPRESAGSGGVFWRAFLIATVNAKSLAGYLAAFSQFVEPDVPIGAQMWVIVPTALTLTALSYTGYAALGAGLGRAALAAVWNVTVRRVLAACFVVYGLALGGAAITGGLR